MSRFTRTLIRILDHGLSFLYQTTCLSCGSFSSENILCSRCIVLEELSGPHCRHCGDSLSYSIDTCGKCEKGHMKNITRHRSSFYFTDSHKRLFHEIKYRSAFEFMRVYESAIKYMKTEMDYPESQIIPVPLHKSGFLSRGFNQSELLARLLSQKLRFPLKLGALMKVKKTPSQSLLNQKQRTQNLKGSFAWNKKIPVPERVILVDDILTTGSTLNTCGKILRREGVREIYSWTLFRSPMK